MRDKILLPYNLQFFAEESTDGSNTNTNDGTDNTSDANNGDNSSEVDAAAFAELISDKDKRIESLEKEINQLKKSNAEMLVKISAGTKQDVDIGQSIIDMCDTRKLK